MREIVPGIFQWSSYSKEKGIDFNGLIVEAQGERVRRERVIVDPPPASAEDLREIERRRPYAAIVITNRDHTRESAILRERLGTKVLLPKEDAPLADLTADGTYDGGERLPAGLIVIRIPYAKSPGECALLFQAGGVLIVGDAVIGKPPGSLSLLPPDKFPQPDRVKEGLKVLLQYPFDVLLVGDGASVLTGGRETLSAFLRES